MRRPGFGASRLRSTQSAKAIILCGGDKSGIGERRFYRQLIKKADARFGAYLAKLKDQKKGE
jgi:hypothetical protein